MTVEDRVTTMEQREAFLHTIFDQVMKNQARQDALLERLVALQENQEAQMYRMEQDSAKLQRMWVWLCRKNGWPEDE